jgi:hypothetical protein
MPQEFSSLMESQPLAVMRIGCKYSKSPVAERKKKVCISKLPPEYKTY